MGDEAAELKAMQAPFKAEQAEMDSTRAVTAAAQSDAQHQGA